MSSRSAAGGYLALLAVCFFWGTTYLGIRIAVEGFPPAVLISIRYFLSGGITLLAAYLHGSRFPRGKELRWTALCGVIIIGAGNGTLAFAEQWVPSGLASLVITTSPFWYVIFEALLPGGAPLHGPTVAGMAVGFAGTAVLFFPTAGSPALPGSIVSGLFLVQLGVVGWCLGSIMQRRYRSETHPIVIGGIQQMASSLAFAPLALLIPHAPFVWKPRAAWAVAYLVVFGSLVGYSAYAYALARLPVAITSIYPYVNAVVAVALGWWFYREPFGSREAAAMLVIFAGVAIVKWQSGRAQRGTVQAR